MSGRHRSLPCHNPPAGQESRSALTLVELLVTVAIAALLAAVALPTMERATRRAGIAQSTSNLRSISSLVPAYAADHNGILPPLETADSMTWDVQLIGQATGAAESIFAAQLDRHARPAGKTPRSYSLNPRFAGKPQVLLTKPSQVALIVERHASLEGLPAAYVGGPPVKPTGYSDFPYEGKTQIALADGSVAMVERLDWLPWHRRYIDPDNPDWQ